MKFEESFDAVYDKMKKESRKEGKDFVVSPQTAKMLTFFWNMLILSKNKLDDEFVFIDNDYNIVSMPLKEIEEKTIIPGPEDDTNAEPEENEGKKPQK